MLMKKVPVVSRYNIMKLQTTFIILDVEISPTPSNNIKSFLPHRHVIMRFCNQKVKRIPVKKIQEHRFLLGKLEKIGQE